MPIAHAILVPPPSLMSAPSPSQQADEQRAFSDMLNALTPPVLAASAALPDMGWDEFKTWWAVNVGPVGDENCQTPCVTL